MDIRPSPATAALQHRFNAQLPYQDRIPTEAERLLFDVTSTLTSFDAQRDDIMKVLRGCSGLERMRDLKYSVDDATRSVLVRTLHDITFPETGAALPWRAGNKVMSNLAGLIGKNEGRLALEGAVCVCALLVRRSVSTHQQAALCVVRCHVCEDVVHSI